ncbi:MAG: VWA domain-containing protein [Acidobacteria bacterium]|jgi:Ca-activated chloride channel family protein|nr:VWA domain-containing protein [Acidobacteriota bacterium]
MFRFAAKLYLLLLLLLPLLAWWRRYLSRRGQRHVWFPSRALLPAPAPTLKAALVSGMERCKAVALLLFILALARPQWLNTTQVEEQRGLDILLTLDISGSMAAIDFKPKNRLEVAKEVIASFIEKRRNDRLGLVVFAATSTTKCPLTVDYDILKFYLQETELGELEDGTAIGMALAAAVNRIRHSTAKTKIIILLTDGVNNRGEIDPRDAAKMARDFRVKVYAIGVGTRGEAPYPVLDSFGRRQHVMVNVEIDESLLREMAGTTGGLYFRATDRDSLQSIFSEIDRWEKTNIKSRNYYATTELFPWFIGLGLLLLLLVEAARRSFLRTLP